MTPPRATTLRAPGARWARAAGVGALVLTAWVCMYGKLWCFERFDAHRFTARAMLDGTLQLRSLVTLAGHDEQVHDGAVFTNWGFGVPLLQLPFHALARAAGWVHGFFPDRAIYFVYVACALPMFWAASERLLAMRGAPTPRDADRPRLVAWAATWLVLNWVLFPLMSTRFAIFEETIAYMTLCELLALAAYVWALGEWRPGAVAAMGAAAGLGLAVRSTGAVHLAVLGAVVALQSPRRTWVYAAAAAPFVAFFVWTNWVRSGSPLGLGYGNSNPAWEYEMPILRFGSSCIDSVGHAALASGRLLGAFFLLVQHTSSSAWLRACHFDLEERDGTGEPYFGPAVLVLLVALVAALVRRRERRLALWVPYAAMAALFAVFVRRGEGFAWRYVGDFWPLILLAVVQHVHAGSAGEGPGDGVKPLGLRTAHFLFWGGFAALAHLLVPWQWSSGAPGGGSRAEYIPASEAGAMEARYRASHAGVDESWPSRRTCGEALGPAPFDDGMGWRRSCGVGAVTNVYLGVARKAGDRYALRLRTEGVAAPSLTVYVNGRVYQARRNDGGYEAVVDLRYAALTSPIVEATVLWSPPPYADAGGVRLLAIELV